MYEELKTRAKISYDNKDYQKALELYEELKNIDINKFEKQCIFNYMWCLYRVKINTPEAFENNNIGATKEIIKYILDHQNNKDILFQITVLKIINHLKKKQNFEAYKINVWLDKLDPDLLSEEVYVSEYEGKKIVYKSNKEEWYALKSKVYEKLEMYSECIKISEEALDKIKELHNGNDIWFKRRIAISKSKLEQKTEAIEILSDLIKLKKDWFIYKDIGDVYLSQNKHENALSFYINAILATGDDDKKINLFWKAGNIFNYFDKPQDEILLKSYSIKLRIQNDWKLDTEEKSFWNDNKDYIDSNEVKLMRNRILKLAKQYKWKDSDKLEGCISKIMPDNKAGFIKAKDKSYYFRMNEIQDRMKNIQTGTRVNFFVEKGFDKKKGRETDNAVNINIIK